MTPTVQTTSSNPSKGDLGAKASSALDPNAQPFEREEADTLYDLVQVMLETDRRFVGLSHYVTNISFFWSYQIKTACAGHGFIFFNPNFYDSIPVDTRKTVVAMKSGI